MKELPGLVDSVRWCPFGCGWKANRKLKLAYLQSTELLLPGFIERCQHDLVAHLVADHGASAAVLEDELTYVDAHGEQNKRPA